MISDDLNAERTLGHGLRSAKLFDTAEKVGCSAHADMHRVEIPRLARVNLVRARAFYAGYN
jgi:hypothetical protein